MNCLWSLAVVLAASAAHAVPPHLEKQGTAMRLMVKDKPMPVLGGELGNSSATSASYMKLSPAILANQGLGRMSGFKPRVLEDETVIDMPVTELIGG